PNYKGKVLIVQGDRDFIVSTGVVEKALRLFPNASIKMIPGAGHGFGGEDFNTAINASVSFVKETVLENR
ncbi:MAG TPA: alpha/beta hydrolase, partial [Bacillota bacterium]|nr:alpha/beta hydrolase [Bacillota bacterium]